MDWIEVFLDSTRCPDEISESIHEMWETIDAMNNPLVTGVVVLDSTEDERTLSVTPDVMAGDTARLRRQPR